MACHLDIKVLVSDPARFRLVRVPDKLPTSPITGSERVEEVGVLDPGVLAQRWIDEFRIDVSAELRGIDQVSRYRCLDTGLEFYRPPGLAGSADFYAQLQDFAWYYRADRWEHARALERLPRVQRVLEVGAGSGAFARALAGQEPEVEYLGLELNPRAVEQAKADGLSIVARDLNDEVETNPGSYDLTCSFQVLEHVAAPGAFLRAKAATVKPGGRVLVGVPNRSSYLGDLDLLLDLPPHHMTHWTEDVLRAAAPHFGCETEWVECEPLQPHQVSVWVDGWLARRSKQKGWAGTMARVLGGSLARGYVRARRSRFKGEVLLASFVKTT